MDDRQKTECNENEFALQNEQNHASAGDLEVSVPADPMSTKKGIGKKAKALIIVLICMDAALISFFVIHAVVYSTVSGREEKNMNRELEGKTFVFYRKEKTELWVAKIQEDKKYTEKVFRVNENGSFELLKSEEDELSYDFDYWGKLLFVNSGIVKFDSNENVTEFGADHWKLATDEDVLIITTAEEREATKHTLYDFMMPLDDYRTAYKASGMPVSENLIDLDMGNNSCLLYKDESTNTFFMAFDRSTTLDYQIFSNSLVGKNLGYDYMMGPILLYLKNIPGAITDIDEIVKRWDAVAEHTVGDEIKAQFEENGITYTRSTSYSGGNGMVITVDVYSDYVVYLADYPDFLPD